MRAVSSYLRPGVGDPRLGCISFHTLVEDVALSMFVALATCHGWSRTRVEGGAPALPPYSRCLLAEPTLHLHRAPNWTALDLKQPMIPGQKVLRKDLLE